MASTSSVSSFLSQFKVDDLFASPQHLVTVEANDPIPKVLQNLMDHKIYSVPVFDPSTSKYIGFIDMLDLVTFVVQIFQETETKQENFYEQISKQEKMFAAQTSRTIADLSHRNPFVPVETGSPLIKALEILGKGHVHRVPITKDGKVIKILTQTMVIDWLWKNRTHFETFQKTLSELNLGTKAVISINFDSRAIDAFKIMTEKRVSAVAILNEQGKLLSNISAKDLKAVTREALFGKLYNTVISFASDSRSQEISSFSAAITCHPADQLEKVIGKLAATKIHRIYVTEANELVGVISLSDIIAGIAH